MSSPINACLGGYALCRGSKITGAHGLSSSSSKYLWRPGFLRIHVCILRNPGRHKYLLEELESPWAPVILLPLHNA